MPRKLDPIIAEVLKKYDADPATACWNCHGVWVVYHRTLEQVAATAGITFDTPQVIEGNGETKCVALCVTGHLGERSEWSIGEASPHNYIVKGKMQAYPYAMAEKRGKDRVILKLIGLHGLAYSEEEADDFKGPTNNAPAQVEPPKNPPGRSKAVTEVREFVHDAHGCSDGEQLMAFLNTDKAKKFAFKICCDFPNDWIGEEDNSGLSGTIAQLGEQLGCANDVGNWIARMEQARKEKVLKTQEAA